MDKKESKSDKLPPKSSTEADFKALREQSQRFKANKNCSEDDLVPFLGHGGTHKAVKTTASHGDCINADHAPQFSILNYMNNLENMPEKLKDKIEEKRRLENLVSEYNAKLVKENPTNETRSKKKASASTGKTLIPAEKSSQKQDKPKKAVVVSDLDHYNDKLYEEMATLSIPIQLHKKMPTTLKPSADITNLTDKDAETVRQVMEQYTNLWIDLIKAGVIKGHINDNHILNQANQSDLQEKVCKIWEDNFEEILGYWLQFKSKKKKAKSGNIKSEKSKPEENISEKEKYMKELQVPYRRMVLCTTIYYVKTPEMGYKRLINLYLYGYKLYLTNFEHYKLGIIRYLETSRDFGWTDDQDVAELIKDYSLHNTESNLMSTDDIKKWRSFANLIKADDDRFKATQLKKSAKQEPVSPTMMIENSGNTTKNLTPEITLDDSLKPIEIIKREPTDTTEMLERIYKMVLLMSKDLNETKQDVKQIKEEQRELKIELNHLRKGSLNEQQMTELSPQIGETFKSGKFEIPQLTDKNSNNKFLNFPTGIIYFKDIKTVQPALSKKESNILAGSFNINVETANWMVDSVLSGFLFRISDYENPEITCLTPTEVQYILSAEEFDKRDHLSKCKQILIPFNQNGNHWILIIMKPETNEILVFDPVDKFKLLPPEKPMTEIILKLKKYFNYQLSLRKNAKWKVKKPEAAVYEDGTEECGPFVCFYAEASVRGSSLMEMPDVKLYREHVIRTLIGSCEPSLANEPIQIYSQSKIKVSDESVCNFCWTRKSKTRLRKLHVRNNDYSVCE